MEVPRYVIDASVATKWHLQDEEVIQQAQAVLDDFRDGRIRLLAPDLLRHEVASALLKATWKPTRPRRLPLAEGRRSLESFFNLGIEFLRQDSLIPPAYDLAGQWRISYYDALYLASAVMTDSPLIYADEKLRRALRDRFPLALWIVDYRPEMA